MNARAYLRKLGDRINALALRERALLALAALAIIFLFWDMFTMKPLRERHQQVQTELQQVSNRVAQLTSSIQQMAVAQARDPNREVSASIETLSMEISALEQQLVQAHGQISQPRQAVDILAGLLAERDGLDIITLENRPAEAFRGADGNPVPGLFVHRVRLVAEADHAGVREYLDLVSRLPSGIFLESMELTVPAWPVNRIELVLFSLTLDENWLGV